MQLAQVVGTVVATQKSQRLDGLKMLILRPFGLDGKLGSGYLVALDAVGAGPGEVVLYCTGSSARQTEATKDRPADAVIMAIVDTVEVGGDVKYQKDDKGT
ncbi:MAG: ethanolamine utilization protein EutN [Chloroflexota bacterium]|nr:ethanolamine utilization protein EutN [Chloroflexota bacterium]NOG65191.1 EutN/CcmL family microcompartment protein [Chloroflexota bacterium]GIK63653.1 MAG: ethanolamine utilization protein EutN [Chloroflexota bacterium]